MLFVHGAWHAAWCWEEHFLDYFAAHGYPAYALSLRGHGGSDGHDRLRSTRLADFLADVEDVAAKLPVPPVLVGHSMGGAIVQRYLETRPAPGAVLLGSVPPSGALATALRIARRHPTQFARANLSFSLYPLVSTPELVREAFFSDSLPREKILTYCKRLQDESYLAFLDMLVFGLSRTRRTRTPVLVIGAANDVIFEPYEIESTARAYQTEAEIFPNMAHDLMLEPRWQAVADRIIGWMDELRIS